MGGLKTAMALSGNTCQRNYFSSQKSYIHVDFYICVCKIKLFLGLNLALEMVNCPGRKLIALTLKK